MKNKNYTKWWHPSLILSFLAILVSTYSAIQAHKNNIIVADNFIYENRPYLDAIPETINNDGNKKKFFEYDTKYNIKFNILLTNKGKLPAENIKIAVNFLKATSTSDILGSIYIPISKNVKILPGASLGYLIEHKTDGTVTDSGTLEAIKRDEPIALPVSLSISYNDGSKSITYQTRASYAIFDDHFNMIELPELK